MVKKLSHIFGPNTFSHTYKFIYILLRIFEIFKNTKKINRTSSDQLDKKLE